MLVPDSVGGDQVFRLHTMPLPQINSQPRPSHTTHIPTGAGESESEEEEEEDVATAATTVALGGLSLQGPEPLKAAALGRLASTASLGLSRVGSEGSDLSGYVIGADLQPHQQPQPGSAAAAADNNNVVVVQLECPRCQCIDRRCVYEPLVFRVSPA